MPLIKLKNYQPPFPFKNYHASTIYPSLMRTIKGIAYTRERWDTSDGDFLDLDWSKCGKKTEKLVVALHGLEGSSDSKYIKGIARIFNSKNWDALAMNFRGCSGELNRVRRQYHSGETSDLDFVLNTIFQKYYYEEIVLIGFSLGGNVVMKFAGEKGTNIYPQIKKVIGVSVPIDLAGCCEEIEKWHNFIYQKRFLKSLKSKFKIKKDLYPDLDHDLILNAKTFADFDGGFTAPVHGFESAEDYWYKCSSRLVLSNIAIPALIINAKDDSFLSETCYPYQLAEKHSNLYLSTPKYGGHVGFPQSHPKGFYWTEERIMEFVEDVNVLL